MKISIITVTYNRATTIRDTFDSVLSQSYSDYELIVVDGQSKDGTMDIVRSYQQSFGDKMCYISEPDSGIYDAMNKGISMATGDVIGILNSDDFFYDNDVLKDINDAFTDRTVDCIFGNLVYVDAEKTSKIRRIWKGSPYYEGCFSHGWVPAHPTFYVRREYYKRYGLYKLEYKVSSDFELMIRFLAKYKLTSKYVDRYFIRMRLGGESNGSLRNIFVGNNNIIRAFKDNGQSVPFFYPVYRLVPKVIQMLRIKLRLKHVD